MLGRGRGVGGERQGLGRIGMAPTKCVCPKCGYTMPKERGVPCKEKTCPVCGVPMEGRR